MMRITYYLIANMILFVNSYSVFAQLELPEIIASRSLAFNPAFTGIANNPVDMPGYVKNADFYLNTLGDKVYNKINYLFAADKYIEAINSSLGLALNHNRRWNGFLTTSAISLNYAYRIHLKNYSNLQIGVSADVNQQIFNPRNYFINRYCFYDLGYHVDNIKTPNKFDVSFYNLNAGISYANEFLLLGFSLNNINRANIIYDENLYKRLNTIYRFVGFYKPITTNKKGSSYQKWKNFVSPGIILDFEPKNDNIQYKIGAQIKNFGLNGAVYFSSQKNSKNAGIIAQIGYKLEEDYSFTIGLLANKNKFTDKWNFNPQMNVNFMKLFFTRRPYRRMINPVF